MSTSSSFNASVLETIASLQAAIDKLRREHSIHDRGALIYKAFLSAVDDESVVVEADGVGGGKLMVVEGDYPFSFTVIDERSFAIAADAVSEADAMVASN